MAILHPQLLAISAGVPGNSFEFWNVILTFDPTEKVNLRKGQLATVPLQKPLLQHTVLRGRSGSFSSLPGQLKDGRRVGKSNELQAPRTVTYLMVGFKSGELMYGTANSDDDDDDDDEEEEEEEEEAREPLRV